MATFKLTAQERAASGFTHAFQLLPADLTETVANTAQTIAVDNVESGYIVTDAAHVIVTALSDASDAAFNSTAVTLGDGNDVDRFLVSQELNENGTEIGTSIAANDLATLKYAYTGTDTIDLVVNSMAAKSLSDIDTGEVWFFWKAVNLSELAG